MAPAQEGTHNLTDARLGLVAVHLILYAEEMACGGGDTRRDVVETGNPVGPG